MLHDLAWYEISKWRAETRLKGEMTGLELQRKGETSGHTALLPFQMLRKAVMLIGSTLPHGMIT